MKNTNEVNEEHNANKCTQHATTRTVCVDKNAPPHLAQLCLDKIRHQTPRQSLSA